MKSCFEKGTIVFWTNDGEVVIYDSINEAYEKEHIELSKEKFIKALGTDREVKSGVTAFRYGIDEEATADYNKAMAEVEEYNLTSDWNLIYPLLYMHIIYIWN